MLCYVLSITHTTWYVMTPIMLATLHLHNQPGVPWFGLVSAQGANSKVPAPTLAPLHPLLYTATKGRVRMIHKGVGGVLDVAGFSIFHYT